MPKSEHNTRSTLSVLETEIGDKEPMTYDVETPDAVRHLILKEREKSLSHRELAHRLMGFGYRIEKTDAGLEVKRLVGEEVLMTL